MTDARRFSPVREVMCMSLYEVLSLVLAAATLAVNIIFLLIGSTDKFGTAILTYLFRPLFVSESST